MANPEHLERLKQGVDVWNAWRASWHVDPERRKWRLVSKDPWDADLNGADLNRADLSGANLSVVDLSFANLGNARLTNANLNSACLDEANLSHADLNWATLTGTSLMKANLMDASLSRADAYYANLAGANLRQAWLPSAQFHGANFSGVDLSGANLCGANFVEANLSDADLTGCHIYGISAWKLTLNEGTKQRDLVITNNGEPEITTDDIEVAQFLHLMLNNEKMRNVIDAVVSKVVLILGRFSDAQKPILDAIRIELRRRNLVPVLFDFSKPSSKDLTGTVETLARMARFIIADLTDPSSIPHELATIVPFLRTTPVLPLRLTGSSGYGMFKDLQAYPWVLPTHEYSDVHALLSEMGAVIAPAHDKARVLRGG